MTGLPAGEAAAAGGSMATTGPAETSEAPTDRVRVVSTSAPETLALGERLGRVARAGDLVCLWGDLGAGKTQLTKGIAIGLDIDAVSPAEIAVAIMGQITQVLRRKAETT